MSDPWAYQIRLYLSDALAEAARADPAGPAPGPLADILRKHDAVLVCQLDAFAAYVAEAERDGVEHFPLYRWTKATIDDPEKRARHRKAFALRVGGNEVYGKDVADALEADLQPLVDGEAITRLSRQDTNPTNNIPVPEAFRG